MARRAGPSGKTGTLAQTDRAPGDLDTAQAAEAHAEGVPEAGAGPADEAPTVDTAATEAEAPALVEALRVSLLQRMTAMVEALPGGYYTEIKGNLAGADGAPLVGTFKLRDFAASLKDLAAIGKSGSGPDIEDWSPLAGILGDIDPDYDGDDDGGDD